MLCSSEPRSVSRRLAVIFPEPFASLKALLTAKSESSEKTDAERLVCAMTGDGGGQRRARVSMTEWSI